MQLDALNSIAIAMTAPGRGILAADESTSTIARRFEAIATENTEANRRAYRELMFRAKAAMPFISGVILFDETLWQAAEDGTPLVKLLQAAGAIPGIKVDEGAEALPNGRGDLITKGLDGLASRLPRYHAQGARFAKWRAIIEIAPGRPSYAGLSANAQALARYAALCQAHDIVPIVEPEILMDGAHTIEDCQETSEWVLKEVFQQLYYQGVALEGIVLKPSMVIAGMQCPSQASVSEVARRTVKLLKACVPAAVPGIAFLSGGQSDVEATAHLDAMVRLGPLPWPLTFSYGRALQAAPQRAWGGKPENIPAAQAAFAHRARMNALASQGQWSAELEREGR